MKQDRRVWYPLSQIKKEYQGEACDQLCQMLLILQGR